MAKISNNEKLKKIMKRHRLTQVKVAKLIDYSVDTVKSWCSRRTSKRFRSMPNRALRGLERELELGGYKRQ